MRLSAPIYRLKRQAKLLARESGVPLHEALDRLAKREGFRSWSHLAAAHPDRPAETILAGLTPGDMLLLGARPGHGKTLLALELAITASRAGHRPHVFTLDDNEADVLGRLKDLGHDPQKAMASLILDTSDAICADHIVRRLGEADAPGFAVVDYLQLLDQRRTTPPLGQQVATLRAHAQATGAILVLISQIDRAFENSPSGMPTLADVRLPNPCDLGLFTRTCFLHAGEIRFEAAA